ncbi:Tkp4 protein [Vanderwaltozyma polyspora DSM 70294]|uniref:Tkp4 protein n=1 Tax=Vanderwaltozyma polyspora (strain ATCC 22028 / DSM 70294 / BCRC 21397 / CBS 2163 / NBRC 10782 / NRRL Y-8283 / UCD 57-17) TaxID=436907 RepID=A7TJE3_VANPO|nr:Tkp4 protein [Vanderwaltozyma polyspora DSM 70294]EDO17593.1 Tkp4 protein [Vanderwaltozyma polyspora DSM 70294]
MKMVAIFYEVLTKNNQKTKFFYKYSTAKLDYKLDNINEFYKWVKSLREFTYHWKFHDITTILDPLALTSEENYIVKNAIKKSLNNTLKNSIEYEFYAVDMYNSLKSEFMDKYSSGYKKKLWRNTYVDLYCTDIIGMKNRFIKLINIEYYSTDTSMLPIFTNSYFISKIQTCLHPFLLNEITRVLLEQLTETRGTIKLTPFKYVKLISDTIRDNRYMQNLFEVEIRKCSHCDSTFHSTKNCNSRAAINLRQNE